MFKISNVKTRYYEFENPDSGKVIYIEPPKLKTLRKMENVSKSDTPSIDEMVAVIVTIICKNRNKTKVSADKVLEWMDADQLGAFIDDFLRWLNKEKTNDPN